MYDFVQQQPAMVICFPLTPHCSFVLMENNRVWDPRSFNQVHSCKMDGPIASMELSADGQYITSTTGKSVYFWDAQTYVTHRIFSHIADPIALYLMRRVCRALIAMELKTRYRDIALSGGRTHNYNSRRQYSMEPLLTTTKGCYRLSR